MKTAVVTGAFGNLGQAVVKKFLSEGFHVIGTASPRETEIDQFAGEAFEKFAVDLADEDASQNFFEAVLKKYKAIDVLVCTVGGFAMGSLAETKTAHLFGQYKLNFETAYNIARPVFGQMMQEGKGRIFLVGSRPALDAKAGKEMVAYSMAKSLIFHLAELMNAEAKGKNVVVSVIVPSTIDTPQNRKSMPSADPSKWVKPEAIAETISFYCSDVAEALREPIVKLYNNS